MSISPFFYIEVFNYKTGNWEKVDVYTKNSKGKFVPISVWTANGTHDLFTVLKGEDSYELPEFTGIHYGFPINASQEMYAMFDAHCCTVEEDGFEYVPDVKFFNLADAKLYLQKYPMVEDADKMEEYWCQHEDIPYEEVPIAEKGNPLQMLIDRIEMILEIWDEWWRELLSYSDIRIIYWLSH